MEMKLCEPLVIVLIGRTGVGKSATANYLTSTKDFLSRRSIAPITKRCQVGEIKRISKREVIVVDTPGLGSADIPREHVHKEIQTCLQELAVKYENPKFCLAIILGIHMRLTDDDFRELGLLGTIFGLKFYDYTFCIWTHADLMGSEQDFGNFVKAGGGALKSFLLDVEKGKSILISTDETCESQQLEDIIKRAEGVSSNFRRICMREMKGKRARRMRQAELKSIESGENNESFLNYLYRTIFPTSSESRSHVV